MRYVYFINERCTYESLLAQSLAFDMITNTYQGSKTGSGIFIKCKVNFHQKKNLNPSINLFTTCISIIL